MTLLCAIQNRHSGRSFDPDRLVLQKDLDVLIEAARWAPSCYGEEPWRFLIIRQSDSVPYQAVLTCLDLGNQIWAKNASLFMVILCATKFLKTGKLNRWAAYDTGAAVQNIMLQATEFGLMAHQMGGFNQNMIIDHFTIPESYDVMSVMAIGYELHPEIPMLPRNRRPKEDVFFYAKWPDTPHTL